MYEEQKRIFEDNLRRCELKPTRGHYGTTLQKTDSGRLVFQPDGTGRCCALTPSVLGHASPSGYVPTVIARDYQVSPFWAVGCIAGFDGDPMGYRRTPEFLDGYAWGQEMARKYIKEESK